MWYHLNFAIVTLVIYGHRLFVLALDELEVPLSDGRGPEPPVGVLVQVQHNLLPGRSLVQLEARPHVQGVRAGGQEGGETRHGQEGGQPVRHIHQLPADQPRLLEELDVHPHPLPKTLFNSKHKPKKLINRILVW